MHLRTTFLNWGGTEFPRLFTRQALDDQSTWRNCLEFLVTRIMLKGWIKRYFVVRQAFQPDGEPCKVRLESLTYLTIGVFEIMRSKIWCVVLAVLGLVAFEVDSALASGGGAKGSHAGGGPAVGHRTGRGGCQGNSWQFLRAENGIFGPTWACGNATYWGYGGTGCGLGYGCGYSGWGDSPLVIGQQDRRPYFAQFPPVYYGYSANTPVLNRPIGTFLVGSESSAPTTDFTAPASLPRPPLRIINPYYVEAKVDKP